MNEIRLKLRRAIAKHYGHRYVDEVLSMLQVGSTDYCDEVIQSWHHAVNQIHNALYRAHTGAAQ